MTTEMMKKMKNDRIIKKKVQELHDLTADFLTIVNSLKNQNAYTDRIIESIIKKTAELKDSYNEQFEFEESTDKEEDYVYRRK